MIYANPNTPGSVVSFKPRYDNFIGGEFVPPIDGRYFENPSPCNGKTFCEVARSNSKDIELAFDAAHGAKEAWGKTNPGARALILNKIADRMEANLEMLAVAEAWENGKGVRETLAADLPLAIDHFRYFAGCIRAQEGTLSQLDEQTVAYHFHEPLGVVAQIIPVEFPASDGDVEIGARFGGGQLRGHQTRRTDTGHAFGLDGTHRRFASGGRGQHRQRLSASRRANRSRRVRAWPKSPSPAKPRPGV